MNKFIFSLIVLIFLNNCSFNQNSKIWKNKDNGIETSKNTKKFFDEKEKVVSEHNQGLKFNLNQIKNNNKILDNKNNFGSQNYKGQLNKIGNYKFSKIGDINKLDLKPIFLEEGIIFFDKKGTIIKYDKNQKVIWKKNYYSKSEKKLLPKLNFLLDEGNIIITDNLAKLYSIKLSNGELNWSKYNSYSFNSRIKKNKDKFFSVDYKNILRCYEIKDGSECWNFATEDSFTVSNAKYSLIILNNSIIFSNSLGDITAVDIDTGLIVWQLPTQNSAIINEAYNFKVSKIVSDGDSVFFSNNKNEFYSIDGITGNVNWINKINSILTPILIENLIFTVSNEGYLFVIEKKNGNIIRVTDLFKNYKTKKRENIYPIGFVIGNKNLYLTNSDGKMIVVGIEDGKIIKIEKVSGGLVSEPFIFNNNLYVIRNGSILQYN